MDKNILAILSKWVELHTRLGNKFDFYVIAKALEKSLKDKNMGISSAQFFSKVFDGLEKPNATSQETKLGEMFLESLPKEWKAKAPDDVVIKRVNESDWPKYRDSNWIRKNRRAAAALAGLDRLNEDLNDILDILDEVGAVGVQMTKSNNLEFRFKGMAAKFHAGVNGDGEFTLTVGAETTEYGSIRELESAIRVLPSRFKAAASLNPAPKLIARVGLFHGSKLCMGIRTDGGRWTTPGGHCDEGETPLEGAVREVAEETGVDLEPSELQFLAQESLTNRSGEPIEVHVFKAEVDDKRTTTREDPDDEVKKWEWIDVSGGLPAEIASNLHTPPEKDVLLKALSLVPEEKLESLASTQSGLLSPQGKKKLEKKATSAVESRGLPSIAAVKSLLPELCRVAQKEYDEWVVDPENPEDDELDGGGICHLIADDVASALGKHGIDVHTISSNFEQHVYCVGAFEEGVFEIDLPYSVYETGAGYSWQKTEGVKIQPDDWIIHKLDSDPDRLNDYLDDGEAIGSANPAQASIDYELETSRWGRALGAPVKFNATMSHEGRALPQHIELGKKFFDLPDDECREQVLYHEYAHFKELDMEALKDRLFDLADAGDLGTRRADGSIEGVNGQSTPGEIIVEAYSVLLMDPSFLKRTFPKLYEYTKTLSAEMGLPQKRWISISKEKSTATAGRSPVALADLSEEAQAWLGEFLNKLQHPSPSKAVQDELRRVMPLSARAVVYRAFAYSPGENDPAEDLRVGQTESYHYNRPSSWTKDLDVAEDFGLSSFFGQNWVIKRVTADPKDVLCDTTLLDEDDRESIFPMDQREVIMMPGELRAQIHAICHDEDMGLRSTAEWPDSTVMGRATASAQGLSAATVQAFTATAATLVYPYFHVTDFSGVPNAPNIYLGIKGEKYSTDSHPWDSFKYFWNAQLEPSAKLFNPDRDWDCGMFTSVASQMGFDDSFLETSKNDDVSFYKELIDDGKYEDLSDLVDRRPHYGFHILKAFSEKGLFHCLQQKGYRGIYDKQGKYLYEAADLTDEPQILIFNASDIAWGERVENEDFQRLSKEKVTAGQSGATGGLSAATVQAFCDSLESKHQATLELRLTKASDRKDAVLKLEAIVVPKNGRGLGVGTKILKEIEDFADLHDCTVVLSPSKDLGASSVGRLKTFYGRFGFVSNSGKNKDFQFTEAMIRYPLGLSRSKHLDRLDRLERKVTSSIAIWYHGRKVKDSTFDLEHLGEGYDQEGPGLYFTSSRQDAAAYAYPAGIIMEVELDLEPQLPKMAKTADIHTLISHAPDLESTLANWDENPKRALVTAQRAMMLEPKEAYQQVWINFYRYNEKLFLNELVKLGYHGRVVEKNLGVKHAIVFDPKFVRIVRTEDYVAETAVGVIGAAEVAMARVSRFHEHLGITYLYPAQGGASVAIAAKGDGTYWVLLFKPNKVISAQVLHHLEEGLDAQKMIVLLLRYAGEKGFLKKNLPSVTPKELSALLLKKEGLNLATFQRLFPELKDASTEDALEVEGMKILHVDSVKHSDTVLSGIKKAIAIVRDAGFGHLIYGEVFLIGSAMKNTVAADYNKETDQVRFKGDQSESGVISNFIHELGHRQYYKFKVDEAANNAKYNEVIDKRERLKVGDVVKNPKDGKEYTVLAPEYSGGKWKYRVSFDDNGKTATGKGGEFIEYWEKVGGDKAKRSAFDVSSYAKTKNTEYWAEVFSVALTTKNQELLAWVKEVTV